MELVGAMAITMSVSGYTNAEGVYPFQGQMYSEEYTRPGVCACGWSYPLGTIFIIKGKEYICLDRGSAITDNHIDIWFADVKDADEWGRKELSVLAVIPNEHPRGAFR
jgi:3D (Asp-Asp-Asp) domain-containing protein